MLVWHLPGVLLLTPVDLSRLLHPESIAVFGGVWARNVVEQCLKGGYQGKLWPVHPKAADMHGVACLGSVSELPAAPDAAFVGINREASIETVRELREIGCGGVVAFASGFSETQAEDSKGVELEQALKEAAGDMPLVGPNCYGLLNYADGAMLWPDQHGGSACQHGVALLTQSSNIAINLTMQQRALPIVHVMTAGNQMQLSIGQLGQALLQDERVTALGLYVESVGNVRDFEAMAALGQKLGKPIVAIKAGRSDAARRAMLSHTNSLAGNDAASDAFMKRVGVLRVDSPAVMLETLKLLHVTGPLTGNRVQSMSCSGGEAALMADTAHDLDITYPPLGDKQSQALRTALGPKVALANPLDYHTYIWDDHAAMRAAFAAMMSGPADITVLVLDFPRGDRCDSSSWKNAVNALAEAAEEAKRPAAVLAILPENLQETDAALVINAGLVPLAGIGEGLEALTHAALAGSDGFKNTAPVAIALPEQQLEIKSKATNSQRNYTETEAKTLLAQGGVDVPRAFQITDVDNVLRSSQLPGAIEDLDFPVVLKVQQIDSKPVEHKSDIGGVQLGIADAEALQVALAAMHQRLAADSYLVEEQMQAAVVELLVSVVRDDVYGLMLTIAAGGVFTEVLKDSQHLLLPVTPADIESALGKLKVAAMLDGYRGGAAASRSVIVAAVDKIQNFALSHKDELLELEINPLLCGPERAIAADSLLAMTCIDPAAPAA